MDVSTEIAQFTSAREAMLHLLGLLAGPNVDPRSVVRVALDRINGSEGLRVARSTAYYWIAEGDERRGPEMPVLRKLLDLAGVTGGLRAAIYDAVAGGVPMPSDPSESPQ